MFTNAQNFSVNNSVLNNIGGNYVVHQYNEKPQPVDFASQLLQNFNGELDYSHRHEQNKQRVSEGTCNWLMDQSAFAEWRQRVSSTVPVLWVHGPPGSGKSTLCSQTVQSVMDGPDAPSVAYHFCDHAKQYKEVEVLSMLAYQLLATNPLEADIPTNAFPTASALFKNREYVRSIITFVARSTEAPVYIFIDGVDEELGANLKRWGDAIYPVLEFFIKLAVEFPQNVRLWVTSQPRTLIRRTLERFVRSSFLEIDLVPFAHKDISTYLLQEIDQIEGPGKDDLHKIFHVLESTAESSFLWARLMVEDIRKRTSLREIQEFIQEGFPQDMTEYYQKMFDRFPAHLRSLGSKVFSLIVYAKRPLQFHELWEALWALYSKNKEVLDPDDKPYETHLTEVFQSFIELVPSGNDETGRDRGRDTCRLIHSTLKDYLLEHRRILFQGDLDQAQDVRICPEIPVTACLDYLHQSRFADLLRKKDGEWADSTGIPVLDSRFLIYAAKYWDKHLDGVEDPARQDELVTAVAAFVKSTNFWTVMQVQTVWVQAQFSKFYTNGGGEHDGEELSPTYLRRMFPSWFMASEEGFKIWIQYRSFLRQWRYFLCCGRCSGVSDTTVSPYTGELHHIWTGALGLQHFLRERESSVTCFPIADQGGEHPDCFFFADLTADSGDLVYTLRIDLVNLPGPTTQDDPQLHAMARVIALATLECKIQVWTLNNNAAPTLKKEQTLRIAANSCDIDLYIHSPGNPYGSCDRAPLAAFASDGAVLRVGSKIFKKDERGRFCAITYLHKNPNRRAKYIEEFAVRGPTLVIASRTRISEKDLDAGLDSLHDDIDDDGVDEAGSDDDSGDEEAEDGMCIVGDDSGSGKDEYASSDDSEGSDSEFASDDDSVSEGSSEFSDDDRFDDDMISPWADDQYASSDEASDNGGGGGGHWKEDDGLFGGFDSSDSEEEEDSKNPPAFGRVNYREEDDHDWEDLPQYLTDQRTSHSKPRATISIFYAQDDWADEPYLWFEKKFPLRYKVYKSPPVVHPNKPLVVWPLGDGDILFIDYEKSTSFTRRLRPAPHSRHISIQCSFSECGGYMHIAALEGCKPDAKADPELLELSKSQDAPLPPISLAMLVSTYRLSTRKTTKSPPKLIHRAQIDLKKVKSINTKQLPFNLTWRKDYLYITASFKLLRVWRVPLFSHAEGGSRKEKKLEENTAPDDSQPVMAPEKVVFLPQTCRQRSVRFFPPVEVNTPTDGNGSSGEVDDSDQPPSPSSTGERSPAKVVVGFEASSLPVPEGKPTMEPETGCSTRRMEVPVFRKTLFFEAPIVCYLDEEEKLGEWVDSKARTSISQNLGVGVLDPRMEGVERFDPDYDCELEPYYY